jgi:hypothetical protein
LKQVLYRGYGANVTNMGLVTGFQFFLNGGLKKTLLGGEVRAMGPGEQIAAGFGSGALFSSFPVGCLIPSHSPHNHHVISSLGEFLRLR